jgi:hypothetical protein
LRRARLRGLIGAKPTAAIDATGLDSHHASRHYGRRLAKRLRQRRFVLLTVACHAESHLLAAAEVRVGPTNESPPLYRRHRRGDPARPLGPRAG